MISNYVSLPLEPLIDLAKRHANTEETAFTDRVLAQMVGVHARTIARWRAAGDVIPWNAADSAAIHLGEHPIRVWGNDWLALDADVIADDLPKKKAAAIERAMKQIGQVLAEQVEQETRGSVPA